jgi:hypothetical protein
MQGLFWEFLFKNQLFTPPKKSFKNHHIYMHGSSMHQKYLEQCLKCFFVERCHVGKQMAEAHHEEKQGCSPLEANYFWYF